MDSFVSINPLAAVNYSAAFDNLGWLYYNEGDIPSAVEFFRQGAKLGNAEAMVSYAQFIIEGKYGRKDLNLAYSYYQEAAKKGHPFAIGAVKELEEQQRRQEMGAKLGGAIFESVLKGLVQNQ